MKKDDNGEITPPQPPHLEYIKNPNKKNWWQTTVYGN